MDFSQFLQNLKKQKKLASAKDHYAELGGKARLGISLRHFQQIESGKYPPSQELLLALFQDVSAADRRALVLAFFKSSPGKAGPLLNYLDQYLLPSVEPDSKNLWQTGKKSGMYSEDQLEFLTLHTDAMRFHRRILLLGAVPKAQCILPKVKLDRLIELDLVSVEGNRIQPGRNSYRVPNDETSGPREVARASDYILKQLDHYISREGGKHQVLGYGMQMVSEEAAARILEQVSVMKRWVQSLASTETGKGSTPLLFVGFAKKIESREL